MLMFFKRQIIAFARTQRRESTSAALHTTVNFLSYNVDLNTMVMRIYLKFFISFGRMK